MAEHPALTVPVVPSLSGKPWTQRLMDAAPISPIWVGLGIALAQFGFFLAYHALLVPLGSVGLRSPLFWETHAAPQLIMSLLIGYSPTAMAYSHRASLQVLEELRGVLRCSDAGYETLRSEIACFPTKRLRWIGAGFAFGVIPMMWLDPTIRELRGTLNFVDELWLLYANALVGWLGGRAVAQEIRVARIFSRAGEELAEVDPLDLAPLRPFARRGLQSVLLWVIAISIFSLIFLGPRLVGEVRWASDTAPGLMVLLIGVAVAALLLPVLGVHRRIRAAKQAELDRIHDALRRDRETVLQPDSPDAQEAAARLPGLVALRGQIASSREWPFDASSLFRFALYLAIGLGSWLGGALVERLVDLTLG